MTPASFSLPASVQVRDVTLRDGLQSVARTVPLADKLRLYRALARTGVPELQVTSFVSPARLPQLADAPELWAALRGKVDEAARPTTRLNVLVANTRGYERAVACGALDIEAVLAVSETYSRKNAGRSREQALQEVLDMLGQSELDSASVCVSLANTFHCVYEGAIDPAEVREMVRTLHGSGAREILLCDTTGHAHPDAVFALCGELRQAYPDVRFGAHLHDTRGRGLANALAALQAGVTWFDAALGGLGGSPFAPGVGGNLSLELLLEMLHGMEIKTGIDLPAVLEAAQLVSELTPARLLPPELTTSAGVL